MPTAASRLSSVLAVVSAEITKPFGDRGSEGMLQFATSFSGMAELGVDNSSRCCASSPLI
jgi:exosome complex RNA-binding protein Rrp42 (RNase PH superfamily)